MSESKEPQESKLVMEQCSHMIGDDLHWLGMTIRLGPKRIILLCKDCTDQVKADVLGGIVESAVKDWLSKRMDVMETEKLAKPE